jgi:GR25 family glycosyltransferase involved in LPS biosynthesis
MNNINDIKNIFYINLDTRPDRKAFFENQMKMIRLKAVRFKAIKNSCGALGCSLSHLALLKYAKKHNLDHILIMEDDIMFLNPQIFIQNINNFLSNHKDFDVLLIAGNNMGEYTRIDENCVKIQKCQTTTGYLVKSHYYDKLIHNFEQGINHLIKNINLKDDYAIDQYWTALQLVDTWYLLTPLTVSQKADYSDIEKRHINYNYVMLDLDKTMLRKMRYIQEQKKLPHPMNSIIHK